MAKIFIVNPQFEVSYWGLEHALPLLGKRANLPTACLPLLAALTPDEHDVVLVDENVEPIDYDQLAGGDIVALTGMSVQRARMREILTELKNRGVFTVVGGPWATVDEAFFADLTEVIFVGEAEETWPQFLEDWKQGDFQKRYEQTGSTDMTKVPTPRFDQLKMKHYLFGSLQISRGCPFQCEFCDIIVTFGRRPRLKHSEQVIAELEALRAVGHESVFVVDDNLIGNKKAIKVVLRDLIDWQVANGYPLMFFTEASLDLADDAELMQMMCEANFVSVFIGIESPNEESLKETKKLQNLRAGGTIIEKVHRVQDAGLDVWCGMIVGFDNDDETIFDAQWDFLHEARIGHASIGMLYAVPKTPLHDRLRKEGRLDEAGEKEFGTNIVPLHMDRERLRDGYKRVMSRVYATDDYFERIESLFLHSDFHFAIPRSRYWRKHPVHGLGAQSKNLFRSIGLAMRLLSRLDDPVLRREYRRRIFRLLRHRREPVVMFAYVIKIAMHYHHYRLAQDMQADNATIRSTF